MCDISLTLEDKKRAKLYFLCLHASVWAGGNLFHKSHLLLGACLWRPWFPPSGLHMCRKNLVVCTYMAIQLDWAYPTGGEVSIYILQAWDFWLDWLFFIFLLLGIWQETKYFSPSLNPSQLSPSLSTWFFQWCLDFFSKTYIPEFIYLHTFSVMQEAAKHVMLVVLLVLEASQLSHPTVL